MKQFGFQFMADISIYRNNELFLGQLQIKLLQQVMIDGSIHSAAKSLKMSYQHVWHILDKVNRLSPIPVIFRQKGGRDGGGCGLSPFGLKLMKFYEERVVEINRYVVEDTRDFKKCFL